MVSSPSRELEVTRLPTPGIWADPGDVLVAFSPGLLARRIDDRQYRLRLANLALTQAELDTQGRLAALEGEERDLRSRWQRACLDLRRGSQPDPDLVEQRRLQEEQARIEAGRSGRSVAERQSDLAAGLGAPMPLAWAEAEAERTRLAAERARRRRELDAAPPTGPKVEALRLSELDLRQRLGVDPAGVPIPGTGVIGRLAALRSQAEAELAQARGNVERAEAEVHEVERSVADITAVAWLTVAPPGGEPVQRVRFAPPGRAVPDGWIADHGRVWNEAVGHGWDRPLQADELRWREQVSTAVAGGRSDRGHRGSSSRSGSVRSDPKTAITSGQAVRSGGKRRTTTDHTSDFPGGVAVLPAPAVFSLRVPNGRWQVAVGLGDAVDWEGPAVQIEGISMGLPGRTEPGLTRHQIEVEVRDGRLDVRFHDGNAKALRAPIRSWVTPSDWARVGSRYYDGTPLAYCADPDAVAVEALVPQEYAALVAPGRTPGGTRLEDQLVATRVEICTLDGAVLPAEVVRVGAQGVAISRAPVGWGEADPADRIARSVRLRPLPGHRGRLRPGDTVRVAFRFQLPAGCRLVPPHLVRLDEAGAELTPADGKPVHTQGLRLGDQVVVRLPEPVRELPLAVPPAAAARTTQAGRFRGEVVPGVRSPVSVPPVWGKVADLVPDGSQVTAGQVIVSLYNPWVEQRRSQRVRDLEGAVQRLTAAAESRKARALEAIRDHQGRILAEAWARIGLRQHHDQDPLLEVDAADRLAVATRALALADDELARTRQLSQPSAARLAELEAAAARARIELDRARIDAAATRNARDLARGVELFGSWLDSLGDLGLRELDSARDELEERARAVADRQTLDAASGGSGWERSFDQHRELRAPVAGRILFRVGWNEQTRNLAKIDKEFWVWNGMTLADIVDETRSSFSVQLPERLYAQVRLGAPVEIELAQLPGRPIPGTIAEVGRAFLVPEDDLAGPGGARPVASRRVFTVTATLQPAPEAAAALSTGAKGWLRLR